MRLALLLAVCLVLAGCSSKEDPEPAAPETPDPSQTQTETPDHARTSTQTQSETSTTQTQSEAPAQPHAPTAKLTASVTEGTAPLVVTLGLNGTDADGDALSWTLDLDGDGQADETGDDLPTTLNHTFATGTYNLTLMVSDGGLSTNDTLQIVALEPEVQGWVYSGEVSDVCDTSCEPVCDPVLFCYGTFGAYGCQSYLTGEPGGDCIWFELPAASAGHAFVLRSTGGDPDMQFQSSCSPDENDGATAVDQGLSFENFYASSGEETGTVPADALCAVVWEWESAPSTLTLEIV